MLKLYSILVLTAAALYLLNAVYKLEQRVEALESLKYGIACIPDKSLHNGRNKGFKCLGNGNTYKRP